MDKHPLSTIAALLGCPEADLAALIKRGILAAQADGYDLTVVRIYCDDLRAQSESAQRARLTKIKADTAEAELERRRGEWVAAAEVQRLIQRLSDAWGKAIVDHEDKDRILLAVAEALDGHS